MKQFSFLVSICIVLIIRPAAGWSENIQLAEEFGIVTQAATFWIGLPGKENALAYLKIPEGTLVKILEEEGIYYRINHKDLIGYVEQKLVKKVPDVVETMQETKVTDPTPPPAGKPASKIAAVVQKDPGPGSYLVTQETSLRESPDSQARVLYRLPVDGRVEVLEAAGKYWWKAAYKGKTGWVKCALLLKE